MMIGRTTIRDVQFTGALGHQLTATLELPAGTAWGQVVMAHCFTCTSASHATHRISRHLADRGFAVLRFDFTGLGDSAGDFAETTFTSNVDDLTAAARWLGEAVGPVGLMIGHSLGGAAVIAASSQLSSVRAVVTLAAPASPGHVRHLLSTHNSPDAAPDRVLVRLGNRSFHIGTDFLDDISEQPQLQRISSLNRPLLVLHSPVDQVVGIDNARLIFDTAQHPKSFVALDGADHMLSDRRDAEFVGDVIAAWATRYL